MPIHAADDVGVSMSAEAVGDQLVEFRELTIEFKGVGCKAGHQRRGYGLAAHAGVLGLRRLDRRHRKLVGWPDLAGSKPRLQVTRPTVRIASAVWKWLINTSGPRLLKSRAPRPDFRRS